MQQFICSKSHSQEVTIKTWKQNHLVWPWISCDTIHPTFFFFLLQIYFYTPSKFLLLPLWVYLLSTIPNILWSWRFFKDQKALCVMYMYQFPTLHAIIMDYKHVLIIVKNAHKKRKFGYFYPFSPSYYLIKTRFWDGYPCTLGWPLQY